MRPVPPRMLRALVAASALFAVLAGSRDAGAVDLRPVRVRADSAAAASRDSLRRVPVPGWTFTWFDSVTFEASSETGYEPKPLGPEMMPEDWEPASRALERFVFGHPEVFRLDRRADAFAIERTYRAAGGDLLFQAHHVHQQLHVDEPPLVGAIDDGDTLIYLRGALIPGLRVARVPGDGFAAADVAEAAHPGCVRGAFRLLGQYATRRDGGDHAVWRVDVYLGGFEGVYVDVDARTLAIVSEQPHVTEER